MKYKNLAKGNKIYNYVEFFDDEEYYYEIDACFNQDANVIISPGGMSVVFEDRVLHTNITPASIFPFAKRLQEAQLVYLLQVLQDSGYEGKFLTLDEINSEVWLDEDFY